MGERGWSVSSFTSVIRGNSLDVLINILKPRPLFIKKDTWPKILKAGSITPDLKSDLIDANILVEDESQSDLLKEVREQALRDMNRPTILYLMLSQGCNARCTYCPIPDLAKKHGEKLMSIQDAIAGVNLWREHINRYGNDGNPFFIILYGGEPLLNKDILSPLLKFIDAGIGSGNLPAQTKIMLCTNGLLVDKAVVDLCLEYRIIVSVGLDGINNRPDSYRLDIDGSPTFDAAIKAIRLLVDSGVEVVSSVTISPENINYLNHYSGFFNELGVKSFGFNFMKGLLADTPNYARNAALGVASNLNNLHDVSEYQLLKRINQIRQGKPFAVDCTCFGNQIVIQADGQIGNCPFERNDQGHVSQVSPDFDITKADSVGSIRLVSPILGDAVFSKRLLSGGGCPSMSSDNNPHQEFVETLTREIIFSLIPKKEAEDVVSGNRSHWYYRGIGNL